MKKLLLGLTLLASMSSFASTCTDVGDRYAKGECIVSNNKDFIEMIDRDGPSFKIKDITSPCGYDRKIIVDSCKMDNTKECLIIPVHNKQVSSFENQYKNISVNGYKLEFKKYDRFCWN